MSKIIDYDFAEYSNKQIKHVIDKINSGRKIYYKTLIKYELEHLADKNEVKKYIIFPKEKIVTKAEPPAPDFTDKDILDFIDEYYSNPKTKTTYKNAINKNSEFNSNTLKSEEFWNNINSITHLKQFLSPISTYISENFPIKYNEIKVKIANEIRNEINKENERAFEKTNLPLIISADEILEKFDSYIKTGTLGMKSKKTETFDGLWLGFYSVLPVRDDFAKVSFINRLSEGFNYLNLEKSEITILRKKGCKNDMTYKIPEPLLKLIEKSLYIYPRDYLFTRDNGEPLGTGNKNVTRAFNRIFNKKITINDIRKSFATKANNSSPQEMLRMAQLQRHSVDIAILYYTRQEV